LFDPHLKLFFIVLSKIITNSTLIIIFIFISLNFIWRWKLTLKILIGWLTFFLIHVVVQRLYYVQVWRTYLETICRLNLNFTFNSIIYSILERISIIAFNCRDIWISLIKNLNKWLLLWCAIFIFFRNIIGWRFYDVDTWCLIF